MSATLLPPSNHLPEADFAQRGATYALTLTKNTRLNECTYARQRYCALCTTVPNLRLGPFIALLLHKRN